MYNAMNLYLSKTCTTVFQVKLLGSILNITILGVSIIEPVPSPGDPAWQNVVALTEAAGRVVTSDADYIQV